MDAYPYAKNHNHSSIQFLHIAYLILGITFGMVTRAWHTHLNEMNHIDVFCMYNHMQKIKFIPNLFLRYSQLVFNHFGHT